MQILFESQYGASEIAEETWVTTHSDMAQKWTLDNNMRVRQEGMSLSQSRRLKLTKTSSRQDSDLVQLGIIKSLGGVNINDDGGH